MTLLTVTRHITASSKKRGREAWNTWSRFVDLSPKFPKNALDLDLHIWPKIAADKARTTGSKRALKSSASNADKDAQAGGSVVVKRQKMELTLSLL